MKNPNTRAVLVATCISVVSVVSALPTSIGPSIDLALGGSGTAASPGMDYGATSSASTAYRLSARAVTDQSPRSYNLQRRATSNLNDNSSGGGGAPGAHSSNAGSTEGSPSMHSNSPLLTFSTPLRESLDSSMDSSLSPSPGRLGRSASPPPSSPPASAPPSPVPSPPPYQPLIGPVKLPNINRDDASFLKYLGDNAKYRFDPGGRGLRPGESYDDYWVKEVIKDTVGYYLGLRIDQIRYKSIPDLEAGIAQYLHEHPRDFEREPDKRDYYGRAIKGYMMQLKYGPGGIPADVQKMLASPTPGQA